MLSRYFVFIALIASCSIANAQGKSDPKKEDEPRLFRGGLIKRFENLQERLQKEREERQKQREKADKARQDELRKTAESKKSAQVKKKKSDRSTARSISDQDTANRNSKSRIRPENDSNRRLSPIPDSAASPDMASGNAPSSDLVSQTTTSQKMSLGIEVDPGRIGASGLSIETIDPKGPAALAGMVKGDRIISVGSSPIKKIEELQMILEAFEPGDRTEIEFVRKNKKEKTLVEFPAANATPRNGIALNPPTIQDDSRGAEQLPSPNAPASNGTGLNAPLVQKPSQASDRRGLLKPLPRNGVNAQQNSMNQSPRPSVGQVPTGEVRAGLGVTALSVTPALFAQQRLSVRQGAFIEVIEKDSAADKAGLKAGVVVIAVDGRKIDSALALSEVAKMYQPGQTAQVMYYEGNRLKRTPLKFDAIPVTELSQFDQLGNLLPNSQPGAQPNGNGVARSPNRNGSILGPLADEFPRLRRIDEMIERFTPEQNQQPPNGSVEYSRSGNNPNREAVLQNEVQSLRGKVIGQDQQIKALTEKLNAIEKLLDKSKK